MKAVTALLILCFSLFLAAQEPQHSDVARGTATGLGFTLELPPNVEMDITPRIDLALGLNLSETTHGKEWDGLPFRYIGIEARWNNESASVDEVIRKMTVDLNDLVPSELVGDGVIRLASVFPAKLGELPAKRLVVEFKNRQKKPAIRQIVVGYRTRPGASAIVYLATLTTTRDNFPRDVDIFAKLLAGFKLTPVE
jgi:hypothetical protein